MLFESTRLRLGCADGVATMALDESVLTRAVLADMNRAVRVLENCGSAQALLIRGGKPGRFLSGPDLAEYASLGDDESRRQFARAGQKVFERLENLSTRMPTIAFIDGTCANAGLRSEERRVGKECRL